MRLQKQAVAMLANRLLVFLFAVVMTILLLHVQGGILNPLNSEERPTFSFLRWAESAHRYLVGLMTGDLGVLPIMHLPGYMTDQPVSNLLWLQWQRSASLYIAALVICLIIGTFVGFLGSRFSSPSFRYISSNATMLLLSTPDILQVLAMRAVISWGLSTFGIKVIRGMVAGGFEPAHVVGPALVLATLPLALVARASTVAFDDFYHAGFVRTARAKGLSVWRVMFGHVLKNAGIQILATIPVILSSLVVGQVVVEYVFYYPGLGRTLGLVLERAGRPAKYLAEGDPFPSEATASIVLVLLVGVVVLDLGFAWLRLRLDPRVAEAQSAVFPARSSRFPVVGNGLAALGASLKEAVAWLQDLPSHMRRQAWRWRPSRILGEVRKSPHLLLGLVGVGTLIGVGLFGGYFVDLQSASHAPSYIVHEGEVFFPPFPPGFPGYPFGSDLMGRNLMERLILGARYTLLFALVITPLRFLVAVPWGLLAGFHRKGGLAAVSRTLGLLTMALPSMLILAAFLPLRQLLGPDQSSDAVFWWASGVLALVGLPRLTEQIRLQVEAGLNLPFIEGAVAAGAGPGWILRRHLLPHLRPHLWVAAVGDMVFTLLLLAQLGVFSIFMGGWASKTLSDETAIIEPRISDWSAMLSRPYEVIYQAPWALWYPAVCILGAVASFSLLAEGLRRRTQEPGSDQPPETHVDSDGVERFTARVSRRLALEWLGTLALVIVTVTALFSTSPGRAVTEASIDDPLHRSRTELQQVLETLAGTDDPLRRAKTIRRLRDVVSNYMQWAHRAQLSEGGMQEESRGRLQFLDIGPGHRLAYVTVSDLGTYFFWQELNTNGESEIYYQHVPEHVMAAAVYPGPKAGDLLLAGRYTGSNVWVVSLWRKSANGRIRELEADTDLVERLAQRLPDYFQPTLKKRFQGAVLELRAFSVHVSQSAGVEVCLRNQPCHTIPWAGLVQ